MICCTSSYITATEKSTAILCLILNIIFPGTGTIVNGCLGDQILISLFIGILQMVTLPLFLVGWVWSIAYGV
jgi:TM2 domain-containing membrane protein YozV